MINKLQHWFYTREKRRIEDIEKQQYISRYTDLLNNKYPELRPSCIVEADSFLNLIKHSSSTIRNMTSLIVTNGATTHQITPDNEKVYMFTLNDTHEFGIKLDDVYLLFSNKQYKGKVNNDIVDTMIPKDFKHIGKKTDRILSEDKSRVYILY